MSQSFGQSNDGCEYKKSVPYYYKDVAVKKNGLNIGIYMILS